MHRNAILLVLGLLGCEPSKPAKSGSDLTHFTGPDGLEWFETECGREITECRSYAGQFCGEAGYLVGELRDEGHAVAIPIGNMVMAKRVSDLTMTFRCRQSAER
jgi:hypothetical protein